MSKAATNAARSIVVTVRRQEDGSAWSAVQQDWETINSAMPADGEVYTTNMRLHDYLTFRSASCGRSLAWEQGCWVEGDIVYGIFTA